MYNFSVDLLEKALYRYTVNSCYGEWDDDFYLQASYESFQDPTLAACIIMDYIDEACLPIYEQNCASFFEFCDKYKTSLDGRHSMGS
jgi:hypothetical protein